MTSDTDSPSLVTRRSLGNEPMNEAARHMIDRSEMRGIEQYI